jgi:hypothetical protein
MKSFIETAALITGCGSAAFWFASAMCRLRGVKPGKGTLDQVTELSDRLQRMSTWNFWAAGLMGVTALLSVWIRFLGDRLPIGISGRRRRPRPSRAAIMLRGNATEENDHARDVRLRRAREAAVGAYQRPNRAPRSRGQAWNDRVVENQGGRACRCASASARADRLDAQGPDGFPHRQRAAFDGRGRCCSYSRQHRARRFFPQRHRGRGHFRAAA